MDTKHILDQLQGVHHRGGGEYVALCPFHDDHTASLSINVVKGVFRCFGCQKKGTLKQLAEELGLISTQPPVQRCAMTSEEATKALQERGLRQETIEKFRISADIQKQAWQYPVIVEGEEVACRCKAFPSKAGRAKYWWREKGSSVLPYNLESSVGCDEIYLLEGEPDVWVAHQAGVPAVSSTGGAATLPKGLADTLVELGVKTVNICFDLDKEGQKGAEKAAQALGEKLTVKIRTLPSELGEGGDVTDLYKWHNFDDAAFRAALEGLPVAETEPESRRVVRRVSSERLPDGTLLELLYHPREDSAALLVVTPDGEYKEQGQFTHGNVEYHPWDRERDLKLYRQGVVLLPERPEAYGSFRDLVREIRAFIHRYVSLSPILEMICACYVLMTWVYHRFRALPSLRALGQFGTGKTRLLQVVGYLCYMPFYTSGAASFAAIFRVIDRYRGTLVLDEADFANSEATADIVKILNSGYQQGVPLLRCVATPSGYEVEAYNVYGPKLIATRNRYQDQALESRMITVRMGDKPRPDIPITLPKSFEKEARSLRNKLLQYRIDRLGRAQPATVQDTAIEPRLVQIMHPLLSVADDEMRAELLGFMKEYNQRLIDERGMTDEHRVLSSIIELHARGEELSMKRIAQKCNQDEWVHKAGARLEDDISARRVGSIVGSLGLTAKRTGKNGRSCVQWDQEMMEYLARRFGCSFQGEDKGSRN